MENPIKSLKGMVKTNKGSFDPIDGIIMFIIAAVVIYIMFPILVGVQAATPTIVSTSPLYNASTTAQTTIASGTGLVALVTLVLAAVIILSVVMALRKQ